MPYKDHEKQIEHDKQFYIDHKEAKKEAASLYYREHRESMNMHNKENHQNLKLEVFSHYSGGKPRCLHCGEDDLKVLCIDHVDGDGAQHRKQIGSGGNTMYRWLKRNSYPSNFQVLCANCNLRKENR